MIILVIIVDILYKNFEIIIINLIKIRNKSID